MIATGWEYADPFASLAIVFLVVPRALLLLRDAMYVLMESTPKGLSLPAVSKLTRELEDVVSAHAEELAGVPGLAMAMRWPETGVTG